MFNKTRSMFIAQYAARNIKAILVLLTILVAALVGGAPHSWSGGGGG